MLQHGISVHEEYLKLLETTDHRLLKLQLPIELVKKYHTYHDCWKHLVLEIGEDGKRRYPSHSQASTLQFKAIFPNDECVARLIEHDLDFHTLRGDELVKLCKLDIAPTLYLTALAEINANAIMFGGRESESYKIKASRLKQASKKLFTFLEEKL